MILLNGAQAGPTLYVQAGQARAELTGIEAIRRFAFSLDPSELRGRLIAVPLVNPQDMRFYEHSEQAELQGAPGFGPRDMPRLWPGDPKGSPIQRLIHHLFSEAIGQADYVLDLRCCDRWCACFAEAPEWDEDSQALARAFGLGFLRPVRAQPQGAAAGAGGALGSPASLLLATASKCPTATVWLTGRRMVYETSVGRAVTGLTSVARHIGLLSGSVQLPALHFVLGVDSHYVVEAEYPGIFLPYLTPSQRVRPNEPLGSILELRELQMMPIVSPGAGIVYRVGLPAQDEFDPYPTFAVRQGERIAEIYKTG